MTQDAILKKQSEIYDFSLNENGDISVADFFDTAILYSLFGERRAGEDEVIEPQRRRGWIGNGEFENGSKIWLFEQARINRDIMNRIADEAKKALQWLVDDGYAVSIDDPETIYKNGVLCLEVVIRRSRDKVDRRFFELWENTANAS